MSPPQDAPTFPLRLTMPLPALGSRRTSLDLCLPPYHISQIRHLSEFYSDDCPQLPIRKA